MPVIVVANPKGGVGKSTVATNMAGGLAAAGHRVMLGDVDRQQSSRQWLMLRHPAGAAVPTPNDSADRRAGPAPILGWDVKADQVVRPPKGVTHVVLDTPAGLHGKKLDAVLKIADRVLIPLQPSLFDIQATHAFVELLRQHRRAADLKMGLVGMRVREHTRANEQLQHYLATLSVPVVGWLRDTQNYVQLAAHGLTVWDVAPSRVERDLQQWQALMEWAQ